MKQTSCLFSLQSIPSYTFMATSCSSLEILDFASARDPVMALEAQYVFNSQVWQGLGNHPTEALAAQGARSPSSQTRSRWSRSCGLIGIISTFFYSISFSLSSISNWVHAVLGRICVNKMQIIRAEAFSLPLPSKAIRSQPASILLELHNR
jgi:hypothetical protein